MVRVLLVDDEPAVLRSTSLLLQEEGFEVHEVGEAGSIVASARRVRPDVILQDIRMPGLDLGRTIEDIRADPIIGSTPIILFSASLEIYELAEQFRVSHLEKPSRPDVMSRALREAAAPLRTT